MKLILFFLPFFMSVLISSIPSRAQEVDIPLFSFDEEPAEASGEKAPPYIGSNAAPLSSLEILPPPFPSVKVDLPAQEAEPRSRELPKINLEPPSVDKDKVSVSLREDAPSSSQTGQAADFDFSVLPDLTAEEKKALENHARQETDGAVLGDSVPTGQKMEPFDTQQTLPSSEDLMEKQQSQKIMTPQSKLQKMLSSPSTPKKEKASKPELPKKEPVPAVYEEEITEQDEDADDSYKALFGKVTDVYPFDILGFSLKMSAERAHDVAEEKGLTLTREIYSIPEILQVPYDVACRKQGVYQLRAVENCKIRLARENNVYYVSELQFEKKKTKEKVTLSFTTPFKGNVCSKIVYVSKGDNSLGSSPRDQQVRDQRQKVFFDLVYQKYDYPDDSHRMIWGNPADAYLKAYITGGSDDLVLQMEDVISLDEEAVILQKVKDNLPPDVTPFSFAPQPVL